eukprot:1534627-Pleurochrysis_carterae.AAC.1
MEVVTLNSKPLSIEFEERCLDGEYTFHRSVNICIHFDEDGMHVDPKTMATELGLKSQWVLKKNDETNIAKTTEFFRRIDMTEKLIRWLRVRIRYFLHSPPALYRLTRGGDSTFSLHNACPDMDTYRHFLPCGDTSD